MLVLSGCGGSAPVRANAEAQVIQPEGAAELIQKIEKANAMAPKSFSGVFKAEGTAGTKRFTANAKILYEASGDRMSLSFTDFIFKSPISSLFRSGEYIEVYYPAESKLYLDRVPGINIRNYSPVDVDFDILYQLLTGKVPLIADYTVKQAASKGKSDILILENSRWFETLSFSGDYAERIKLTDKRSGEAIELYLSSPVEKDGSRFYRVIRIVAAKPSAKVDIAFSYLKLNGKVPAINPISRTVPGNVKVVNLR